MISWVRLRLSMRRTLRSAQGRMKQGGDLVAVNWLVENAKTNIAEFKQELRLSRHPLRSDRMNYCP